METGRQRYCPLLHCCHCTAIVQGTVEWPAGGVRAAPRALSALGLLAEGSTMLVLSRKVGEKILIGDDIAVTVVRVAQGMVRLGVEAPQDLTIIREEIKDRRTRQA